MGNGEMYTPRKLWFIDKNTGEKAVVAAECVNPGKLSFCYQGKRYAIPVSMLGNRIYGCLPEKPQEKETPSKEIFYQGEHFRFKNGQWVSNNGSIPKETYQGRLSNLYEKRCKHYSHPVKELVSFARKQARNADGINTAIRTLEIATLRATSREAKDFLATLCSLYRRAGLPNAVASLYDYAVGKYGKQVETPPFLTSVSAAFMDIGDIEMADIMRNKASLLSGGDDAKLTHFSRRFDTETQFERDENDEK